MLDLPSAYGVAEMDAFFALLDLDGSGAIDFAELARLLRAGASVKLDAIMYAGAAGKIETEARNRHGVRAHARDGFSGPSAGASVEEMRAALIKQAARVIDFYRHLDVNGDGKVTKAEFSSALPLLGFGQNGREAIDGLFEQLDENGDGAIAYSELAAALRRDDVELAAELQDGAMGVIETKARNAIDLRNDGIASSH